MDSLIWRISILSIQSKAKELLSEIDTHIADVKRALKYLRAQRKVAAKFVSSLGESSSGVDRRSRPTQKRSRTNWDKVIARFKGSFSIDDLAKASGKAKGTVNQAIQNLKKAKKIKSTGRRGEYQRVGMVSKAARSKSKSASKKKAASKAKSKRLSTHITTPTNAVNGGGAQ